MRWPDQLPDDADDDATFRLGRPRQLETVHLLEGLGPGPPDEHDALTSDHMSFAAAVRAEHNSEKAHVLRHQDDEPAGDGAGERRW